MDVSRRCAITVSRCIRVSLLAAAACAGASSAFAAPKGVPADVPAGVATPFQTITSAGPLDQLFIGNDLAAQVAHTGDTDYEVYPPDTTPGDYGTFVVVADTLYAPDFSSHGNTATSSIGSYTAFAPVSQSGVTGAGSAADPYRVTTVVNLGATLLSISQLDSYVVGQESYRTDVTLRNAGATAVSAIVYRAMDCYLGNNDSGYGVVAGAAVGCSLTPNNTPPDRIEEIVPLTPGSHYYQDGYADVWAAIGTHAPFDDTCAGCAIDIDNGAGVSWSITVPAGGSVTLSNETLFSPTGVQPLTTAKSADAATVAAGGQDGYTIVVTNPNGGDATLDAITDTLPTGFAYVAGSSSGATTADPTVTGQTLTWSGAFNVPANGTLSLHFSVTAAAVPGTYYNEATAIAGNLTVIGTGQTAPITVTGAGGTLPLTTAKTSDQSVSAPGGANGYTISVSNPNPGPITLDAISDVLPAGFSYIAGSSSGVTAADAGVTGQTLTWTGPFSVPANGAVSLHFGVLVATTPGAYYNEAGGTATGTGVVGTGPTAMVTVNAGGGTPGGPVPAPTLGGSMLALLGLLLAVLAWTSRRQLR